MKIFHAAILFALPWVCAGHASAQSYPSKPIRLIVPFPAASVPDIIVRTMMEKTAPQLGQPAVVENRVGAGGRIGVAALAKSPADGYTLGLGSTSTHMVAPYIVKSMPYDSFQDFTPIVNIAATPNVIVVHPSFPARDYKTFVAELKKNPGKYSYASSGTGGIGHLQTELWKSLERVFITHIPYRGAGPALTDLLGGQVDMMFATSSAVGAFIDAGKLRALAVTSPERSTALKGVPTIAESVPGYAVESWYGLYAPAGTPVDVVAKLNAAAKKAAQSDEFRNKIEQEGLSVSAGAPEELDAYVKAEEIRWRKIVKENNIQPD